MSAFSASPLDTLPVAQASVVDANGRANSHHLTPLAYLHAREIYEQAHDVSAARPAARLKPYLSLASIGIVFDNFTDGRGFSLAVRLREMGFSGELHAAGAIHPELVHHMIRCGFTHFHLVKHTDDLSRDMLRPFTIRYQTLPGDDSDQSEPLRAPHDRKENAAQIDCPSRSLCPPH